MGHVPTPPADGKVLLRTPAERDASLDPLTPRMQHLRDGILRGLDAC